jgi:ankyrin repeat protein
VERRDVVRAAEIVGACPTPASRAELLACISIGGWTALHWACDSDREDEDEDAAVALAELLLGAGADPRATIEGDEETASAQPIHLAARWSVRLVQRLVAAGASIDGDVVGTSTLLNAAAARTARGVRMIPALVALGARDAHGNMAMRSFAHWPVEGDLPSDEEVRAALTALVSVGCSLTVPDADEDGWTPMDTAADRGNAPVVIALLALGVGATTQNLVRGAAHPDIVRVLLAAGAPPGGLVLLPDDQYDSTPLMEAAYHSALESMNLLLAAGASVHDSYELGYTALMYAFMCEEDTDGTPDVVEALLGVGADVTARDNDGDTPLHWLARKCATEPWAAAVAQLLLESRADASATNNAGKTPAECVPGPDDEDSDDEDGEGGGGARDGELYALLLAAEQA